MSETYERVECDNCKATNYVCLGDISDLSQQDVDAMKCWSCDHIQLLVSLEDFILSCANIEDGVQTLE